jgi:hypothetical protein
MNCHRCGGWLDSLLFLWSGENICSACFDELFGG